MKQPIRFFSIGLLTASLIALLVFSLADDSTPQTTASELNTNEMIKTLEVDGYHVLSSSEYIKLSVGKDSNKDDSAKDKNKDDTQDKDKDKDEDKDENKNDTKDDAQDKDKDENKNEDTTPDDATQANETISYTLTVAPNMLGPDVSKLLLDNNIIDDAEAFNRFLELEGYAPYIQLGDHKVTSDMDHKQIADTIANK